MRLLHRDVGFFLIGLVAIYSISGIVLIYRDTGFLKNETMIEKELSPNIDIAELGQALRIKNLKILKTENEIIYFTNGIYNSTTGIAKYKSQKLPIWLEKLNTFHKASTQSSVFVITTVFGLLLAFMAISSFWMFKVNTKKFRRGIVITSMGFIVAIILILI